jgi:hypothetical protein
MSAYKCWNTRLKEGHPTEEMIEGAKRYAESAKQAGTEAKFIKLPSTFLGPSKPFAEYALWEAAEPVDNDPGRITSCSFED